MLGTGGMLGQSMVPGSPHRCRSFRDWPLLPARGRSASQSCLWSVRRRLRPFRPANCHL